MVHIAILCVLIFIAVMIAPWLIALAIALAAAYGVFMVVVFLATGALLLCWMLWVVGKSFIRTKADVAKPIVGDRKSCPHCQAEIPISARKCDNCGESV